LKYIEIKYKAPTVKVINEFTLNSSLSLFIINEKILQLKIIDPIIFFHHKIAYPIMQKIKNPVGSSYQRNKTFPMTLNSDTPYLIDYFIMIIN